MEEMMKAVAITGLNTARIITGAVNPSVDSFDQAVNLLCKNIVDLTDLVSAVYPMDQAQQAFEAALRPDTYRVVVTLD